MTADEVEAAVAKEAAQMAAEPKVDYRKALREVEALLESALMQVRRALKAGA